MPKIKNIELPTIPEIFETTALFFLIKFYVPDKPEAIGFLILIFLVKGAIEGVVNGVKKFRD
jgi:hypothetical protein